MSFCRPAPTHCVHGHEYNEENTDINTQTGAYQCRECNRQRQREYRKRLREQRHEAFKLGRVQLPPKP